MIDQWSKQKRKQKCFDKWDIEFKPFIPRMAFHNIFFFVESLEYLYLNSYKTKECSYIKDNIRFIVVTRCFNLP